MIPPWDPNWPIWIGLLCLLVLGVGLFTVWAENTEPGRRFVNWLARWF